MFALDYFLYDNQTWAPGIGRDWGIKQATGALAARYDLRSLFDRYCGVLAGERGYLSGFLQALGGMRSPGGDGYLLCATVEATDTFGRPSWAVYGLWCPDRKTLETALAADVLGAVQSALRSASQLPSLVLTSFGSLPAPRLLPAKCPAYTRFDPRSSATEARALLLGALRQNGELPNILGVTASARLSTLGQEFDVVYCHPLDDRSRQAFEQNRVSEGTAASRTSAPPPRTGRRPVAILSFAGVCLALIVSTSIQRGRGDVRVVRSQANTTPRVTGREALLRDMAARLAAIHALNPQDLHNLIRDQQDRNVRGACAALIAQRQLIIDHVARAPAGHAPLQSPLEIQWILDQQPVGGPACRVLRMAYPAEFSNVNSTTRHWCESLELLERAAQTLRRRRTPPS